MEVSLDLCDSFCTSSPLELNEKVVQHVDFSRSLDGDLQECGELDRRWVLWHEFMNDHDHLDAWLHLAEQAVSSPKHAHSTYMVAKEELRKLERLHSEARSRLVQLDSLTHRNQALTQLFHGAIRTRLLRLTRECGQRWNDVNTRLESLTSELKIFISEWEEFDSEREELALLLADLDIHLTEVEHLTESPCDRLRRLQSFQQCVCESSGRVNTLLQRGEALMQRIEPPDAQHVESRLLELLQRCSHIYNNIARTHTRLLSMRLVFEDDWILSEAPDSGCPSESLLDDDWVLEKSQQNRAATPQLKCAATPLHPQNKASPIHLSPPPPSRASPTHDHLGLEWDPSVDIGHSVSCDDGDSSYFSASTALYRRDSLKRRSYLSSLSSPSDISNDITNQDAALWSEGWCDPAEPGIFSPAMTQEDRAPPFRKHWMMITPDTQDCEPIGFDGQRVRAWLGVSSPTLLETSSCSKTVQTEVEAEDYPSCGDEPKLVSEHRSEDKTFQSSDTISKEHKQNQNYLELQQQGSSLPDVSSCLLPAPCCSSDSADLLCPGPAMSPCTAAERKQLQRVLNTAQRLIGCSLPFLEEIYKTRCLQRVHTFTTALEQVFQHTAPGREAVCSLMRLKQGSRRVTDYTTDFRILAAKSEWNPAAFLDVFFQGLSANIQDQLIAVNLPDDLDGLIALAIHTDRHLRD
ncbi:nesprin-2 [Thalassophryne amazonica]|uniref:nesprin-2 n=1 Tax=Thalassophryne amazonica TaxID=390379 RepID=UPI00147157CD|nr:nesprin-2 [Thalassophryne amazonica]